MDEKKRSNIVMNISIIPATNGYIIKHQYYDASTEQQVEDLIIETTKKGVVQTVESIIEE